MPTALLSTHTGFHNPYINRLPQTPRKIADHWISQGITFPFILLGYIGAISTIDEILQFLDSLKEKNSLVILDPVMGDHGKLYSGFDREYVSHMKFLCEKADILIPNLTELALLTDNPYDEMKISYWADSITKLYPEKVIIITGYQESRDSTGVLICKGSYRYAIQHRKIIGSFSGTGDLFAAVFVGALIRKKTMEQAAEIAAYYVRNCIQETITTPAHSYGIRFESGLWKLPNLIDCWE